MMTFVLVLWALEPQADRLGETLENVSHGTGGGTSLLPPSGMISDCAWGGVAPLYARASGLFGFVWRLDDVIVKKHVPPTHTQTRDGDGKRRAVSGPVR